MGRARRGSAIHRPAALVLATQGESRLALWLRHLTGQVDEGLDQRTPVSHGHFPQLHLLALGPVLGCVVVHPALLLKVTFIAQNHNRDLSKNGGGKRRLVTKAELSGAAFSASPALHTTPPFRTPFPVLSLGGFTLCLGLFQSGRARRAAARVALQERSLQGS